MTGTWLRHACVYVETHYVMLYTCTRWSTSCHAANITLSPRYVALATEMQMDSVEKALLPTSRRSRSLRRRLGISTPCFGPRQMWNALQWMLSWSKQLCSVANCAEHL